jgi:hypothetical protein
MVDGNKGSEPFPVIVTLEESESCNRLYQAQGLNLADLIVTSGGNVK